MTRTYCKLKFMKDDGEEKEEGRNERGKKERKEREECMGGKKKLKLD